MSAQRHGGRRGRRGGFALLTVLFVLLALLVLCAPFLMTARNANRASGQIADRAQARLLLDAAARHARARLGDSHPGVPDQTLHHDGLAELTVDNRFRSDFLDANDARGSMWDLDVEDVAGRVDLNSASPHVIANLMGLTTRLSRPLEAQANEMEVSGTAGFAAGGGFLWVRGEMIHYTGVEDRLFQGLERGIGAFENDDGEWESEGPRPPSSHKVGEYVLDQRAFAPVVWRISGTDDRVRSFDTMEQLRESDLFALEGAIGDAGYVALADLGSVFGGVRAGARWQHPVRLTEPVEGGVSQSIHVDNPRYFTEGSTVWIGTAGVGELRYVQRYEDGEIWLNRVLEEDYDAYEAEVRVLARRPVNLNTAPAALLEALFLNLKLRDHNSRVTTSEARALAGLVVASRPFTGLEDFLRRLVLPSAGIEPLPADAPVVPDAFASGEAAIIDSADAVALYLNALNANDARVEYATMPFAFTSRDVYAYQLRAAVNAPSGIERARALRDQVELVAPQRELFTLWATQESFDESMRLGRDAPWWATGPSSTTRYDGGNVPPSRAWAHLGALDGVPFLPGFHEPPESLADGGDPLVPEHVFASREDVGWSQLWASRVDERVEGLEGRVLHFDHETRDPEGRYLPDEVVVRTTDDDLVQWASEDEGGLMRPATFSLWVEPTVAGDGILLDVGGSSRESDRMTLALEGPDLVLRVLDGFGDHLETPGFREATEARFALAGDGPGLPADTWSHVAVDVTGTRPDQVGMLVNGTTHGVRRLGLTRLTQTASQGDGLLAVESTEGFPARGVVRLGTELVEYVVGGEETLDVRHEEFGPDAGFGGRLARLRWTVEGDPNAIPDLSGVDATHPAGTTVQLYGYSAPLRSNLPVGNARLPAALGPFRVAVVTGLAEGEPLQSITAGIVTVGNGWEATSAGGLVLQLADARDADPEGAEVMRAFNPTGGYAAIVQQGLLWPSASPPFAQIGGVEVVRYSGYQGNTLFIAARGDAVANELPRLRSVPTDSLLGGQRAFVIEWTATYNGVPVSDLLDFSMFVVPISIPVPGAEPETGYLPPEVDDSEFAQITRLDQAELTEWVRYDTVQVAQGQLVRDHPRALAFFGDEPGYPNLYTTLTLGRVLDEGDIADPDDDPLFSANGPPPAPPAEPPVPPAPRAIGPDWDPVLGESEIEDYPLTNAVAAAFQFRGVLGTYTHEHPPQTPVLPVFRLDDRGPDGGLPGARDAIFASGPEADHIGWPLVVQRGHLPAPDYLAASWQQAPEGTLVALAAQPVQTSHRGFRLLDVHVALQTACPEPIAAFAASDTANDTRLRGRITKFPSGERPRIVAQVAVGGAYDGQDGPVPQAVVDEVAFGSPEVFYGLPGASPPSYTQGASMILTSPMDSSTTDLRVSATTFLVAGGRYGSTPETLGQLPEGGGLLRVGDEIVAYAERDTETGLLRLATNGRGLLGTTPQPHQTGEAVTYLAHVRATALEVDVGPGDALLPVASLDGFPPEGTVLIERELVHYTRPRDGAIEMPQASREPGARDGEGDGLFRGRYGTAAAAHPAGSAVICFPFRYWDRWARRADAPELAYLGLELDQPGAWWSSVFWDVDPPVHGQCRIGVLQRTDPGVPWDEDPDHEPALTEMWEGRDGDEALPVDVMSDRVEWRVFVSYDAGAFDLDQGLSHGWKETPRLRRLGASYLAPGRVLSSVER